MRGNSILTMKTIGTKLKNSLVILLILGGICACQPQEELFTTDPNAVLNFSEEAVIFDTVFTDIPTVTKRLRVYNRNSNALRISEVYVGGQESSPYRVWINGDEGINFNDVTLLGGDSLLVLVSARLPISVPEDIEVAFDSIVFNTNNQLQDVKLVSWGQNVNVVRDDIACETTWTNERPYLLYDSVLVRQGCTLQIEEGTQIFAFNDAILHVEGQIQAIGEPENRITFQGFRQEPEYDNIPGQWQGLIFYDQSHANQLYYVDIRNANFGVVAEQASVILEGAIIQNMSIGGILAFGANIFMQNTVINNCIEGLFQASEGGDYQMNHCTLANYEFTISRERGAFGTVFANEEEGDEMSINIQNSIFWGNLPDEIALSGTFIINLQNNIFRSTNLEESFFNDFGSQNRINVAADSLFTSPFEADFTLPAISPAINTGITSSALQDLLGNERDGLPDLGAYERQ